MANLNIAKTRELLQNFNFHQLFIEELGWSQPLQKKNIPLEADHVKYDCRQIAQLSGVGIYEVLLYDENMPSAKARAVLYRQSSKQSHENLLIFVNKTRTQSLWYWQKREGNKKYPRDHYYFKGQPGDLFLSKLSAMVVDISELDESGDF